MAREALLAAWQALPAEEQRSILADLQQRADAEGEAEKESPWHGLSRRPAADVYSVRKIGETITVYYFYDFRVSHQAQSGSDWDEHHFHLGEAECRKGRVDSVKIAKEFHVIPEYSAPVYDEDAEVAKRRAAAVEAHWQQGWSLPFPIPE